MTPARRALATAVMGAALLRASMTRRPGSASFYVLTFAVAGTWIAGAWPSTIDSPQTLPLERRCRRASSPVLLGVAVSGVFAALDRGIQLVPALDRAVAHALSYSERGTTPLVVATVAANGVAEEMFFRDHLWSLTRNRRPALATTAAYTAVTAATRNPALTLAGAVMGTLFSRQRKQTGGIKASVLTHLTWSMLMALVLPRLRRRATPSAS